MFGFHDSVQRSAPSSDSQILDFALQQGTSSRPHSSLGPGIPNPKSLKTELQIERHSVPENRRIVVTSILGGLHHEYGLEEIAA